MVELKNDWERVALGGLLHDIGKLFNRSFEYRKKGFATDHPFLSRWFIEYLEKQKIIAPDFYLKEIVQKHHENMMMKDELKVESIKDNVNLKKLALMVAKADNYSSMERVEDEKENRISQFHKVPLDNIFSRVDIGFGKGLDKRYYLRKFENSNIFPKNHSENSQDEIDSLIEELLKDVDEIRTDKFDILYLNLLEIVKKYTWALPSDTQKSICDLSLYEHLKTTSAIGVASYNYNVEEFGSIEKVTQVSIKNGKKEKHFLLIGGDVSGIQKYIYSLSDGKNMAKRLRARSFFIKMLSEIASIKIVNELNLTMSNIVISNSGKFYIVAQNTEETIKRLEKIREEINKELYYKYEAEIFLNLQWIEMVGEDLGVRFTKKYDEINDLLDIEKNKKFKNEILENSFVNEEYNNRGVELCPICRKFLKGKEEKSCLKCERDEYFGTNLPKMKSLAFYRGESEEVEALSLFGITVKIVKEEEKILGEPFLVMNFTMEKEEENFPTISSFYGGFVPLNKFGNIMTFEEIADESSSKNLGILKGDVDNLGMIFSMGLKIEEEDEEGKTVKDVTSISRVSTLSRMIDTFFSAWIPKILEERQEELGSHYIVYSGGDDFMIVGAWDKLLKVSEIIKDEFINYTSNNPNFTISMGMTLSKDKEAIYFSSARATRDEEKSKVSGKNGITFFDTYIPWKDLPKVIEYGEFLIELKEKFGFSQSFVYRLLKYTNMAESYLNPKIKDINGLMFISKFEYDFSRNIPEKLKNNEVEKKRVERELDRYFSQNVLTSEMDRKFLREYMKVSINYAVRKTREGKNE